MALKHQVDVASQRHEMVLKCYKDSVSNAYPTEEEALSNIGQDNRLQKQIYTKTNNLEVDLTTFREYQRDPRVHKERRVMIEKV